MSTELVLSSWTRMRPMSKGWSQPLERALLSSGGVLGFALQLLLVAPQNWIHSEEQQYMEKWNILLIKVTWRVCSSEVGNRSSERLKELESSLFPFSKRNFHVCQHFYL